MTPRDFNTLVSRMHEKCSDVLGVKEKQYGDPDDRLIQFKTAGNLIGMSPMKVLGCMMVKHTTRLYNMISEEHRTEYDWDEVITDHINYLYLLKGVLEDGKDTKVGR